MLLVYHEDPGKTSLIPSVGNMEKPLLSLKSMGNNVHNDQYLILREILTLVYILLKKLKLRLPKVHNLIQEKSEHTRWNTILDIIILHNQSCSKIDPKFVTFLVTFRYAEMNFDQYLQLTSLWFRREAKKKSHPLI